MPTRYEPELDHKPLGWGSDGDMFELARLPASLPNRAGRMSSMTPKDREIARQKKILKHAEGSGHAGRSGLSTLR